MSNRTHWVIAKYQEEGDLFEIVEGAVFGDYEVAAEFYKEAMDNYLMNDPDFRDDVWFTIAEVSLPYFSN